ncbi:MAG: YbjN domain-containing protein [Myxococcota bacterium]|nr:YbjN domain-containing protein [Myxococcota bacterium]
MLEPEALAEQLDTIGWSTTQHDARTFRCVHETGEGEVVVFVRLFDNWLIASVVPFLRTRGAISFELSRWLLRMNRDMYQTKFAYDEDGDVVLTVELPTESIDSTEIRTALSDLLQHAIEHRRTLRDAAT